MEDGGLLGPGMKTTGANGQQPRLYYGWVVVGASAGGLALSGPPVAVYSFGVFLPVLAAEFHRGRGAISLAFTIHNMAGALVAPYVGRLVDRFGARRLLVVGLVMLSLTLVSALVIRDSLTQLYIFYALLGIATLVTSPIAYSLVISRWFDERRGLGLGLMMAGLGVSAIVTPPLIHVLIVTLGWRAAFASYGLAVVLIPMPLVTLLLRESPRDTYAPRGAIQTHKPSAGLEWREIWTGSVFWTMTVAFFAVGATVHASALHMPEILSDLGANASVAAMASSATGLAILVGRVGSGYFLDRFFGPNVAMSFFALAMLGLLMLLVSTLPAVALIAAFLIGLSFGAEVDIIAFLLGRYFGLRALGTAFGVAFAAFVFAGGLGPYLMGVAFDYTGSYHAPVLAFVASMLLAIILMSRLGPYRFAVADAGMTETLAKARSRDDSA